MVCYWFINKWEYFVSTLVANTADNHNHYLDPPEQRRSLLLRRLPWQWPQHRPSSSTPFPWLLQLVSVRYPSLRANMSSAWFAPPLTRVTHWILGPWQQLRARVWVCVCVRVQVVYVQLQLPGSSARCVAFLCVHFPQPGREISSAEDTEEKTNKATISTKNTAQHCRKIEQHQQG